jgi:ribosomal protein L11 methyltransferase
MADAFLRIRLEFPDAWRDLVSARLAERETLGIEENDTPGPDRASWVAYFPSDRSGDAVATGIRGDLAAIGPADAATVRAEVVAAYDWADDVRRNFQPIRVSDRLGIAASWCADFAVPDGIVIRLDPAQAFGTGRHETTQLCLLALEERFDRATDAAAVSVLDVGCGTGILAIYAALRGARSVVAIDVDPVACEMATGNAAANGVGEVVGVRRTGPGEVRETFDVVVANLQRAPLLELAAAIRRAVAPGGLLILSGLLAGEEEEVRAAYHDAGLSPDGERHRGEWACLRFGDRRDR